MTLSSPSSLYAVSDDEVTNALGPLPADAFTPRQDYHEYVIPRAVDPLVFLRNALEQGLLAEDYLLYRGQNSVSIAGNPLAQVTVDVDAITLEYQNKRYRTPATDPFGQMPQILATLPLTQWRAYGYISFDISRFYYAYNHVMDCPLLAFFVPAFEAQLTDHSVTIRSMQPISQIETLFHDHSDGNNGNHHYRVTTPTIDLALRTDYEERVSELINAINQGELHKAIISRSVQLPGAMDIFATYALSAKQNTAARSYCMRLGDVRTVGFSPEILMAVDANGFVMTNPLAATRRRGESVEEDQKFYNELFSDAKEVKEHALSIWLAQSEIDSISVEGTTRIFDFMQVKKYRTVQHLSSRAGGQLKPGYTLWDGLKALFPGITVSGIDKASALAWIDRLEDRPRGVYAGGLGWIDSNGAADIAITLRSIFQYGEQIVFQAGAGIVAESKPKYEYMETVNKMKTMLSYLVME
jgi:salicylate synthetase